MTAAPSVHVIVPGDIDDPALPSGGNAYDRRICLGLRASGWEVRELAVAGSWPRPSPADRDSLARTLAAVPNGAAVLIDGLVACGVPDILAAPASRLPLVVLVHLPLGDELGAAPELAAREREALRLAGAVVATSNWSAGRLVAGHGLAPELVHVVPPGVDPAPLAAGTDGASRLLCVGSVTPTKGQDQLVSALAEMPGEPWQCDLVGPLGRRPEFVASVRAAIGRNGLADRLRLTGPRIGAQMAEAFDAADLLVLPSRVESYGMVATEALARGIPVLAADVGGVREALGNDPDGGVPGILVPPNDVSALAAALRSWFTRPAQRAGVRASARRRRGRLDGWEVTLRRLAGVLERLPGTRD